MQSNYSGMENQYQSSSFGQQRPSSGHHQRTRSFSAGLRNNTITRDTKGQQGSLAVSSSRLVSYVCLRYIFTENSSQVHPSLTEWD